MTEREWLTSPDPTAMLLALPERTSRRKYRLFDCACWRVRAARFMRTGGKQLLAAIAHAEDFADGVVKRIDTRFRNYGVCGLDSKAEARSTVLLLSYRPRLGVPPPVLCALLREVFGNPFRPTAVAASWLTWQGGTVAKLAGSVYEERSFDRMPILADALEESGCSDPEILDHCRRPREHFRGCWVIDLLLGKA
jgi:hypothetical protein